MKTKPDSIPEVPSGGKSSALSKTTRIATCYSVLGILWILISGWWLHHLVQDTAPGSYTWTVVGWLGISATALILGSALLRNIREIRRSTELLMDSAERWKHALEGASQAVWDWNASTNEVFFSTAWKAMLGYQPNEVGSAISEWETRVHPEDLPRVMAVLKRHLDGETPNYASEHRLRCRDGSYKWILDQGKVMGRSPDGKPLRVLGTHFDISARRQAEQLQLLSTEVLGILNDPRAATDASQRILEAIKRGTGIDAVGIRLQKDNHFPYAVAEGFSPAFLKAENDLTSRTCEGKAAVDADGNVLFECTCGVVLAGKRAPDNSLLTPGGSAWSNDARPFLDLPANLDPRLHPRNRCIHEGFQSVALIPIRADQGIIGLLQLNDRRKGFFTPQMIRYFEGLAASFGVALLRLKEEQALRQAELNYRGIYERAIEGIFQADPSWTILSANPAMARIFGFESPEELIVALGEDDQPYGPDPERLTEFQRLITARGIVEDFEVQLRRRDGRRIWVSCNGWAARDANGQILRYEGTIADITARKQTEAVLHERLELQDQLAKVAATVPGMIFSFLQRPDGSACLPFCTPAIEDLWGLRPEDLQSDFSPAFSRTHPDDLSRVQASILESARTLTPWSDTFRVRHPSKGELWLSGHSMPRLEPDGSILWHGFVQDVTESKKVEDSLRQSEERYRNLVETSFDLIWEVDANGSYTFVSPKVWDLLGYSPEEVLGLTPFDLMPAHEADRLRKWFADLVATKKAFSGIENLNRHKDGHLVTLESSGVPILGATGELLGYRGMDRDISGRKRLEEQFRQAQRLEAVGQLAGGVAHDFNNILAATMMHLGLLQMNPDIDAETRQSLKELEVETRRAASLTRQLLMFSRRSVMTVGPVDVSTVVSNLLKMLTRLIGENITLRFECLNALPLVEADAGMLEQVVVNLVVNARDAMPKGGRVTISTRVLEVGAYRHEGPGGGRPGPFVCLTVTDTGHGMSAETRKRIFEPFFTTKEAGKGTGLGLATVHGIVAQHHGWVEVDTEVEVGTSFRVFLPALHQATPPASISESEEPLHRGHETILVVEDDASVRSMVRRSLRLLGYRVLEAENGQAAISIWRTQGAEVDLVLTDMVMPEGMTGLELTEQLQALKPDLKVIISSGYSAEIVHGGVTDKPGIVYLPKPYELETLAAVVRNQLNQRSRM